MIEIRFDEASYFAPALSSSTVSRHRFGMELLATVHWVCSREGSRSEDEAVEKTYAWSKREKGFERSQIALAREVLVSQGWLS